MAWTERYVDASASGSGGGASPADPWTLSQAAANNVSGMRVNVKAGTYSLTAQLTNSASGTASAPIWWRGYKTSAGDLDLKSIGTLTDGTDIPRIVNNNYNILFDGNLCNVSSIVFDNVSGNRPTVYHRGALNWWKNVKVKQAANHVVFNCNGKDNKTYIGCNFVTTGNRTNGFFNETGMNNITFSDCIFQHEGTVSNSWVAVRLGSGIQFTNCIIKNVPNGIRVDSGTGFHVNSCTFVDITDDAIRTGTQNNSSSIANSYFSNVGGYAVGATSATKQGMVCIYNNVYQNCGGELESIYEDLQFDSANDTSDSFVDSASGNYALQSSSQGYSKGRTASTGGYWGIGSTDHSDIGAIQHADADVTPAFHPLG